MKLEKGLKHQDTAVNSIVSVLKNVEIYKSNSLTANPKIDLSSSNIKYNINRVQENNNINPEYKKNDGIKSTYLNLDIKMETGTGKTFTQVKTIFELHKKYGFTKFIIVVPTKSEAECYAALPMIDFVCEDISGLVEKLIETIKNVTIVVVAQATKNATYSGMVINKGDYVALKGERLIAVGTGLDLVAIEAAKGILSEKETNILTVFTGKNTLNDDVEELCNSVTADYLYTETEVVETENTMFNLVLSFE